MKTNTSEGISARIEVLTEEHAALERQLDGMRPGFEVTRLKRQKLVKKDIIESLKRELAQKIAEQTTRETEEYEVEIEGSTQSAEPTGFESPVPLAAAA